MVALLHLSHLAFLFICHANFGHFIPDNYDLVGVGGADGGVGSVRWAWRKRSRWCWWWWGGDGKGVVWKKEEEEEEEEGARAFTPRLLIPLLKGFCSIMPDSFRK